MHCTFCIVPQTRGAERSRCIGEIVAEVRDLVSRGVKEVTLLGQIVNLYGRHEFPKVDNKSPFVQLLEAVHEVEGLKRLRFTSPHPIGFRNDLVDAFARLPKLVEHVHLPLQSGSNRILSSNTAANYSADLSQVRFHNEMPHRYGFTRYNQNLVYTGRLFECVQRMVNDRTAGDFREQFVKPSPLTPAGGDDDGG